MKPYYHKSSSTEPEIILDAEKGIFKIEGRSIPNNAAKVYVPIIDWLDQYIANPNSETVFEIKCKYFNTASSKFFLNIMSKLEQIMGTGHEVLIKWYYSHGDEDIEEAGNSYAEIVEVPFELIEV